MVCVHFVELVNLGAHIIVAFCTLRTIGYALSLCLIGLTGINRFLHAVLKYANVQQALVNFSTKQIFKDAAFVSHIFIGIQWP